MVVYNFKKIQAVPSASDFIDIVLTRTQRRTPTVVHPTLPISRIRAFYMRKVKFTQQTFQEKLSQMIDDFPRLDDIHPFYADLINILYDRDHYKLALGQINTARALIDNITKDYVRMLKFADTLYRCKQLKRAAMGRMCTLMRKQKSSLEYLEEVRKHLSRLPSIDPNTRTLLITGFPNVGKSSFMNKVTRADVDVQPYAFTTKSLYVGHMDYKYLRWQVIDTPGILDHSLEERNTIEMQAVTALAHLQASILFFIDISEQCGFTIEQQLSLFENIRPLFANKPLIMVANKIDQVRLEDISPEHRSMIDAAVAEAKATMMTMSNHSEVGVSEVKNFACDKLLEHRVDSKMKGNKVGDILNRLSVAMPVARDDVKREAFVPESVLAYRAMTLDAQAGKQTHRKTQKEFMNENGGAGVYAMDYSKHYQGMLKKEDWTTDAIPEIWNGKNIADFVDSDILQRLEELEREEEAIAADQGTSMDDDDVVSDLEDNEKEDLRRIREKKAIMVQSHRAEKNHNRSTLPRTARRRTLIQYKEHLDNLGIDSKRLKNASKMADKTTERGRKRTRDGDNDDDDNDNAMDIEGDAGKTSGARSVSKTTSKSRSRSRLRSKSAPPRNETGFQDEDTKKGAVQLERKLQRKRNKLARGGDADRHQQVKLIRWQNSGKRGNGSTNSR